MNHQPFETWLLEDKLINPEQRRELHSHLRTCACCAALLETGKALSSAKMMSPALGFPSRFQASRAATSCKRV